VLSLRRRTEGLGGRGRAVGAARKVVQHMQIPAEQNGQVVHHLCAESAQTCHVTEGKSQKRIFSRDFCSMSCFLRRTLRQR
jgi:hypothetical protein